MSDHAVKNALREARAWEVFKERVASSTRPIDDDMLKRASDTAFRVAIAFELEVDRRRNEDPFG